MLGFVGLRPKANSYLRDDVDENKKRNNYKNMS